MITSNFTNLFLLFHSCISIPLSLKNYLLSFSHFDTSLPPSAFSLIFFLHPALIRFPLPNPIFLRNPSLECPPPCSASQHFLLHFLLPNKYPGVLFSTPSTHLRNLSCTFSIPFYTFLSNSVSPLHTPLLSI